MTRNRSRHRIFGRMAVGLLLTVCLSACQTQAVTSSGVSSHPSLFDPTIIDGTPALPRTRTLHHGTFNGVAVDYEALTAEYVLADAEGAPAATVFSTAYLRINAADRGTRPILFFFNGGPGASSSPLHLGVGPVRRPSDDPDGPLVHYQGSPLDALDMVFVDPVGTGYSRLFRKGAGGPYWSTEGDADAMLEFIENWIDVEGRQDSPLFLVGESYGGTRVITMLARSEKRRFAGVLLLSPAIDMTAGTTTVGNNMPYIFRLPSFAATAAYHGVVEAKGKTYSEIFEDAALFAQGPYAAALYKGSAIEEQERASVARHLYELTGLSEDDWIERDLRISASEFADELLMEQGLRIGRLDTRAVGSLSEYRDRRPPTDDPGFSRGRGGRSTGELLDEYFGELLATASNRPYRTLNLHANSEWDFGHRSGRRMYFSVAPLLQEAMQEDPELRVFVGGGIFDIVTPVMASRYVIGQLNVPADRFILHGYEGGHTVFEHEPSRQKLADDMKSFVIDVAIRDSQ